MQSGGERLSDHTETPAGDRTAEDEAVEPREIDSQSLLGEARELHILHQGARYTLRRTGKGGLILTK